jgi:hypothetical protein
MGPNDFITAGFDRHAIYWKVIISKLLNIKYNYLLINMNLKKI